MDVLLTFLATYYVEIFLSGAVLVVSFGIILMRKLKQTIRYAEEKFPAETRKLKEQYPIFTGQIGFVFVRGMHTLFWGPFARDWRRGLRILQGLQRLNDRDLSLRIVSAREFYWLLAAVFVGTACFALLGGFLI